THVSENEIDRNDAIAVYPNPATTNINISVQPDVIKLAHYKLYNIRGRTVLEGNMAGNSERIIDLQGIAFGVYILELNSEKQRFIRKITKI
ncbi:MAG: T9SS C-terminal target domain-containing protein, partial [Calditrichaeota bacterium]